MNFVLLICCWLHPIFGLTQVKVADTARIISKGYKPEIFNSGFIDVLNNGQVNASARLIRLFIGEPGKFALPISIYSGVSANSFQNQQIGSGLRSNEILVSSFINPLSGLINMSMDGAVYFKRKRLNLTKCGFLYQGGVRLLTGFKAGPVLDLTTGKPINFLNSFWTSGLYLQTGAWERNNSKNLGIFWVASRYIVSCTNPKQLREIMPDMRSNGLYHGWSLGWGVEINNLVNIKVIYYKYVKAPELDYSMPIYQFSFNYSLKN